MSSSDGLKNNGATAVVRTVINEIEKVVLKNKDGMEITCISLGATVTSIKLPDGYEWLYYLLSVNFSYIHVHYFAELMWFLDTQI